MILICNGLLFDRGGLVGDTSLASTSRSGTAAELSGVLSWRGTRTIRQVSPVRSPRPSLALPRFPSLQRHATPHACLLHSIAQGTLSPIHTVCCTRLLHTLVHCEPPPTQALVLPRPLLLSSLLAPFFTFGCTRNRLCHLRSLHVGRTCVAKKDTTRRRLPHGSRVALASHVGCGRWDLLHVRV